MVTFKQRLSHVWKLMFIIVLPIVLLPLLFIHVDVKEDDKEIDTVSVINKTYFRFTKK